MSIKKRMITTVVMAVTALTMAVPANAESAAFSAIETGDLTASHNVSSTCTATGGVALDLNTITYEVVAESTATAQGAVGVGTTVVCEIYNTETGQVYDRLSAGAPGPEAAVADTVTFPRTAEVDARVCGSAVFSDGSDASTC